MVHKNQVINGIMTFMDNHMIPKAEGNYKIILRTAKAGMMLAPEKVWDLIKKNSLIEMIDVVDGDNIDIRLLADILAEGLNGDEFALSFNILGSTYKMHLSKDDIHTLKNYIERS